MAILATVIAPAGALAQWTIVSVSPTGGTYIGTMLDVEVAWCEGDAVPWYENRVEMKLNGTDVSASFSPTGGTGDCGASQYQEADASLELTNNGGNTFKFIVCESVGTWPNWSESCDSTSVTFNYIMYPEPGVAADPHNGDYINTRLCASTCFDHAVSYTTPAYFSLDQPRSVTLMHRSSQVLPFGFVQVDVWHPEEN